MAQRQWRSDDTLAWAYAFGDGTDGDLTISGNTTEAPIDSSCSGTAGTTTLSATNAGFAIGQLILIHQSRGTGVGNWELAKIANYSAGTITTDANLQNTYTDSGASQAQVRVMKQYNNVTINNAITYTSKAWDGNVGGIIGWFAKGTTTITGNVSANSTGFLGGTQVSGTGVSGKQGEGTAADKDSVSTAANGNGGGGGATSGSDVGAGGGGGGNAATATSGSNGQGTGGTGGSAVGAAGLTTMDFGGGGGSGGAGRNGTNIGYAGGKGGGIVAIFSNTIIITGTVTTTGATGSTGANHGGGGGGGGAGSSLFKANTATLGTNLATAAAGPGGASNDSPVNGGGAGSVGRIHLDYSGSFTGSTTPTLDSRQDATIIIPTSGASIAYFM